MQQDQLIPFLRSVATATRQFPRGALHLTSVHECGRYKRAKDESELLLAASRQVLLDTCRAQGVEPSPAQPESMVSSPQPGLTASSTAYSDTAFRDSDSRMLSCPVPEGAPDSNRIPEPVVNFDKFCVRLQ